MNHLNKYTVYKQDGKCSIMADSFKTGKVKENQQKLLSIAKTIVLHGRENISEAMKRKHVQVLTHHVSTKQVNLKTFMNFRVDAGVLVIKEHLLLWVQE